MITPNFKSLKTQLILFLACFALFLAYQDAGFLFILAVTLFSALIAESIIIYLKTRSLQITESSIITGLIIGFVLSKDQPVWILITVTALAIASKNFIRFGGRHIFNPAAFGIFMVTVLFGAQTEWRGTYIWQALVPAGLYFSYKSRKLGILCGYFLAALGLFGSQAVVEKVPLTAIFGYLSYFYIFIMVIEPKTTPITLWGKFIFGLTVAALIFILTESEARFDVELCSLLILNISVPLLNKIAQKRRQA